MCIVASNDLITDSSFDKYCYSVMNNIRINIYIAYICIIIFINIVLCV